MRDLIIERLGALGLEPSATEADCLAEFLALLERWNRVYNLTGLKQPEQLVRRHLAESLALRGYLRGERIADVGSGAGLPGIPLAIVEPDKHFTLIESRAKRARFLLHVQGALNLANVTVEHRRVEDLRDVAPFATVLARAVAALPELVRLTEHLLGPDSVLLVLTKADITLSAAEIGAGFAMQRLESGVSRLFEGALIAVERTGA
jgi:16S rRNA (guanine527-N7)-methyltransferase